MNTPEVQSGTNDGPPIRHGEQHHHHKHGHHHHGNAARGKLWLVCIFFALRGIDILVYSNISAPLRPHSLSSIITGAIWTTALLAGIWQRLNWARYAFLLLMILAIGFDLIVIPGLIVIGEEATRSPVANHALTVVVLGGLARVIIAWRLIRSRDIRRLTDRSRE